MSEPTLSLEQFLSTQVAPRYATLVREAQQRLAAAQQEVDELRSAAGTLGWQVEGQPPAYVNIASGAMGASAEAAQTPFMTVHLSAPDWARFASGAVRAGFGADASGRRSFGRSRIERVKALRGAVRFVITGADSGDWAITLAFGGAAGSEPAATVSMGADTMAEIQGGTLEPQMAFMQGRVKIAGDAGLVMQLGMALFM